MDDSSRVMKKILVLSFVLMGFTFTVTQGLVIRELLVSFSGNELSIGLILGTWLLLEAIGSGLLGRSADRRAANSVSFAGLQITFALFLPLCLVAVYASRQILGVTAGEGVGIWPIFWLSFLILAPLGIVDGAMFSFGAESLAGLTGRRAPSAGRVYVLEALGAILGGIAFTYLFIPFLLTVQVALTLSLLNLIAAGLILIASRVGEDISRRTLIGLASVALVIAVGLSVAIARLGREAQDRLLDLQWGGLGLIYSGNSVYGNVAVTQQGQQLTFYADGMPILTAPAPDIVLSEEMVHLPMLFVREPRRALVLSGGLGGVLKELGKYPLEEIVYAELDPLLIETTRRFPTPLTDEELTDPRTSVKSVDGRFLVRSLAGETDEKFDLVIVNLPYPSTLGLNRLYTLEFFEVVGQLLSDEGVLAITMPGSQVFMSEELRNLNLMAYHTLREVFPHVRPVPDETTLWLASPKNQLDALTAGELVERWQERVIEASLINEFHIRLKLEASSLAWFWRELGVETGQERLVNRDLFPLGLLYGLAYWHAIFSPDLGRFFAIGEGLELRVLLGLVAASTILYLIISRRTGRGWGTAVPVAVVASGFSGMAAAMIMILTFQSLYGYLYHWIGLFIASFMAGMGLGGWLMTRRLGRIQGGGQLFLWLEAGLVVYWLLTAAVLSVLFSRSAAGLSFSPTLAILLALNALGGFLVGAQFPIANKLVLAKRPEPRGFIGLIYASDLVGAFLGAVVVGVLLIPALGILQTCLLLAVLKIGSAAVFSHTSRQIPGMA